MRKARSIQLQRAGSGHFGQWLFPDPAAFGAIVLYARGQFQHVGRRAIGDIARLCGATGDHYSPRCHFDHHCQGWHGVGAAARRDGGNTGGQLTIASFANPAALQAASDNLYSETLASGPAQIGAAGTNGRGDISQGYLEGSNVNIVTELVDMIECQRAYEINSKMVSAVDEMLKNANQTL
jgi:flagellar basal body rod protein FlgG